MKSNCYQMPLVIVFIFVIGIFAMPNISDGKQSNFINKYDKDENGKLSKDEFPGSDEGFEKFDKNQDGYIDEDEVRKARKEKPKKERKGYLNKHDKNGDGKLSKDEFPGSDEAFDNFDKNQDGYIDKDEAHKARKERTKKKTQAYLIKYDKNGDGKLSKDEFPGSEEAFEKFDKNKDGSIDEDEARKARKEKSLEKRKGKKEKKDQD